MIQEKSYEAKKEVEICDVCEGEVGVLQLTHKKDGYHFCASCYTISWVVRELEHGKEYLSQEYYQKDSYKFDQDKLIQILLTEAKKQIKNQKQSP